jgi:sensor histidine kinase YesM
MTAKSSLSPISFRNSFEPHIFIPLIMVLTLVAVISSAQYYYLLSAEVPRYRDFAGTLISKLIYYWYFSVLALIVRWVSRHNKLQQNNVGTWFSVHFATFSISFFVHQSISVGVDTLIWKNELVGSFAYLLFNNPTIWIDIIGYSVFLVSIIVIEYRRLNEENKLLCANLETQLIKLKLNELRTKIHPDFLFNTLEMIAQFVRTGKNRDANNILSRLSDFLRVTVYESDKEFITLGEELSFLKRYLDIELLRMEGRLRVDYGIDDDTLSVTIPNFLIQPIVEEFINVDEQFNLTSEIHISAQQMGNMLQLVVEKRRQQIQNEARLENTPLASIEMTRERLKQVYGQDHECIFTQNSFTELYLKMLIPVQLRHIQNESEYSNEAVS